MLDALRGIAVCLMIEQHLGIWLWQGPDKGESLFDYPFHVLMSGLGGGAAPCFIILAGAGSSLMAARYGVTADGRVLHRGLAKVSFRRGLVLCGFGLALSLATPSWFTWKSWYVLHLMGFGLCFAALGQAMSTRTLCLLALIVGLSSAAVQSGLEVDLNPHNTDMSGRSDSQLASIPDWGESALARAAAVGSLAVRIALAEGHFPIFPWMSLFIIGMACGRWIAQGRLDLVRRCACVALALGAALALAGWLASMLPEPPARGSVLHLATRLNTPFFPASPAMVALLGAIIIWICALGIAWERKHPLHSRHFAVTLGRSSLTLLIVHLVVFREWSRPIDMWRASNMVTTYAICFGFIVLAALASRLWAGHGYSFGAEWLLRKLGGSSPRAGKGR